MTDIVLLHNRWHHVVLQPSGNVIQWQGVGRKQEKADVQQPRQNLLSNSFWTMSGPSKNIALVDFKPVVALQMHPVEGGDG